MILGRTELTQNNENSWFLPNGYAADRFKAAFLVQFSFVYSFCLFSIYCHICDVIQSGALILFKPYSVSLTFCCLVYFLRGGCFALCYFVLFFQSF